MRVTDKIDITNEDNMELMARYPDNYFDLAIVDPPYGIGIGKMSYVKSGSIKTGLAKRTDFSTTSVSWDNKEPDSYYWTELIRVSKNQIVWGFNWYFKCPIKEQGRIVWDKDNGTTNFNDAELALNTCVNRVEIFKFRWNGMLQQEMGNKEVRIHPTQKPRQLYNWILDSYAKEGNKILDTHLGSGSIALACHERGFELTACELDKDYFDKAIERIKNHVSQQKLF
jgi:site-specific DNA-methyltransferase (adenine-specific)